MAMHRVVLVFAVVVCQILILVAAGDDEVLSCVGDECGDNRDAVVDVDAPEAQPQAQHSGVPAEAELFMQNVLKARRSHRSYTSEPVPSEIVEGLLWAGQWAPTARDSQHVSFTVLSSRTEIDRISSVIVEAFGSPFANFDPFYKAPLVIFLIAPSSRVNDWGLVDSCLAAQNMMLYAHTAGLGSCYIGMAQALNDFPEVLEFLGVEEGFSLQVALIFGYPTNQLEEHPRHPPNVIKTITE